MQPVLKENKCLINVPVMGVHQTPSASSPFVSQGIYGQQAFIVKKDSDDWALVYTEDGYQGFAKCRDLIADNPIYRTSQNLYKVKSVEAHIYQTDTIESQSIIQLPYGSKILLKKALDNHVDRWLEVTLLDGKKGWVQRGDIENPRVKSIEEVISLSHQFLERPYVWGGNSSFGFDCSGFVQTLYKELGIILPRDANPQSQSDKLYSIQKDFQKGDLLFFGDEHTKSIVHVGISLGNKQFIHSGVGNQKPKVNIDSLESCDYKLSIVRRPKKPIYQGSIFPINEEIRKKMIYSWKDDNPVSLEDLRYIQLKHWGFNQCVYDGELIVHKDLAVEVVAIFQELFELQYPIEKMLLIDAYQADDDLSCQDNNTSSFCSRSVIHDNKQWSYHSYGKAIDINPLLNPYYNANFRAKEKVIGKEFLDRSVNCQGIITEKDPCYLAFMRRGWSWGGHWEKERGYVDYQHFYKW